MQLKKNHKADLSKNSSLYFAIGLALVLFISWRSIEWKTYEKTAFDYQALNVDDEDDEESEDNVSHIESTDSGDEIIDLEKNYKIYT